MFVLVCTWICPASHIFSTEWALFTHLIRKWHSHLPKLPLPSFPITPCTHGPFPYPCGHWYQKVQDCPQKELEIPDECVLVRHWVRMGAEKFKPSQPAVAAPSSVVELRISMSDLTHRLIDVKFQVNCLLKFWRLDLFVLRSKHKWVLTFLN